MNFNNLLKVRTKTRRLFRSLNPANVRNLPLLDPAIGRDPGMRTGAGPQRQQVREIEGEISVSTHGKSTHRSFPSHTALPHTRGDVWPACRSGSAGRGVCLLFSTYHRLCWRLVQVNFRTQHPDGNSMCAVQARKHRGTDCDMERSLLTPKRDVTAPTVGRL